MALNALKWLEIHNKHYRNIVLDESGLDWMEGKNMAQLPNSSNKTIFYKDVDYAEEYDDKSFLISRLQMVFLKKMLDLRHRR